MIDQDIVTLFHHVTQIFVLRQLVSDLLSKYIMRLHQIHNLALVPDQQMTIACSDIELVSIGLQFFSHRLKQHCCILGTDLT